MIERRREFLLGSGDLANYRMWTALTPSVMQALPSDDDCQLCRARWKSSYQRTDLAARMAAKRTTVGPLPLMLVGDVWKFGGSE